MRDANLVPGRFHDSDSEWIRSFDLSDTEDATSIVPVGRGFLVVGNGQGPTNEAWIALLDETRLLLNGVTATMRAMETGGESASR